MGNSLEKIRELQKSFDKKANEIEGVLRRNYGDGNLRSWMKDLKSIYLELLEVFERFLKEIHNDRNYSESFRKNLIEDIYAIENRYNDLKRRTEARGIDIEIITGEDVLKGVGNFILKAGITSGLVMGAVAIGVPALGFGAAGVRKFSLAATYQSVVLGGAIQAGSVFSILQSVGAAGLAGSTKATLIAGCVAGAAIDSLAQAAKKY